MTLESRARRLVPWLALVASALASTAAHAHDNEIDHRTNKNTWHFDYGITSGMDDEALYPPGSC